MHGLTTLCSQEHVCDTNKMDSHGVLIGQMHESVRGLPDFFRKDSNFGDA